VIFYTFYNFYYFYHGMTKRLISHAAYDICLLRTNIIDNMITFFYKTRSASVVTVNLPVLLYIILPMTYTH